MFNTRYEYEFVDEEQTDEQIIEEKEFNLDEDGLQEFCDKMLPLPNGYEDISELTDVDKQYLLGYLDAWGKTSPAYVENYVECKSGAETLSTLDRIRLEVGIEVLDKLSTDLINEMAEIIVAMQDNVFTDRIPE